MTILPSELNMAVNPPPTNSSIPPRCNITIPSFLIFQILFLKKKKDKLIKMITRVRRPPGMGTNQNQVIQAEKYLFWAVYKPISFCARVPKTTSIIIQIMANTKILGCFKKLMISLIRINYTVLF